MILGQRPPVDIVVPVYGGRAETLACIESVLSATPANDAPQRLVLIDDGVPDAHLAVALCSFAELPDVELIRHDRNYGFVRGANDGMKASSDRDVILLNSDTVVHGDWVDRLQAAAYRDPRIATVTPVTNDGEICSYPLLAQPNPLPRGWRAAELDGLFGELNAGRSVEVPTGVGFCLYIVRACITEVGRFDEDAFGSGYGEEVDFCLRAVAAGWRNRFATDVFVEHAGGVSFGKSKAARIAAAGNVLAQRYPRFDWDVYLHQLADPAGPDLAMVTLERLRRNGRRKLLMIKHRLGGGVERHIADLVSLGDDRCDYFQLSPEVNGDLRLIYRNAGEVLAFSFQSDELDQLVEVLRSIGIGRIHIHHAHGTEGVARMLIDALEVPFDFTVHDYFILSPSPHLCDSSGRFAGEPEGLAGARYVAKGDVRWPGSIESWREHHSWLLHDASRVVVPSWDVADRLSRYFPTVEVTVAEHPGPRDLPEPQRRAIGGEPLRVLVLGALGPEKGADVVEACAIQAKKEALPIEFHLLGYAYRKLRAAPRSALIDHGPYEDSDVQSLIERLAPHVAWFHSTWPETHLYTLTAALQAGLPVVVSDLGAPPERTAGRPWAWRARWTASPEELLALLLDVRRAIDEGDPPAGSPSSRAVDRGFYDSRYLDGWEQGPMPAAGPSRTMVEAHLLSRGPRSTFDNLGAAYRLAKWLRQMRVVGPVLRRFPERWADPLRTLLAARRVRR